MIKFKGEYNFFIYFNSMKGVIDFLEKLFLFKQNEFENDCRVIKKDLDDIQMKKNDILAEFSAKIEEKKLEKIRIKLQ